MHQQPSTQTKAQPAYLRVFYVVALASLIVYILIVGAGLLKLITVAGFLAMLLTPVAGWLEKKHLGHFGGAVLAVLAMLVLFLLLSTLAIRQIGSIGGSLEGAAERVSEYVARLNYFLSWHLNLEAPLLGNIDSEGVEAFVKDSSGKVFSMMGGVTQALFGILIVPAITFFILFYRGHLFQFSVRFLRHTPEDDVRKHVEAARLVAQHYFVGMMKVVSILAILNSGMLLMFGVENAIFFAVFAAFLNVVPFIGPLVGSLLPILYVLVMRDSLFYPIGIAVSFFFIQLFESNYLTPRIIGRNVRINPLVVFLGLLVGSMIWGVMGMIIIIPVLSISMQLCQLAPRTEPFAYLLGIPPTTDRKQDA